MAEAQPLPRSALFIDKSLESVELSSRGLSDLSVLSGCTSLVSVTLCRNVHLRSCDGLDRCRSLWSVDMRGCALTSVDALLGLGALSELQLGGNRLELASALHLRSMALGRLGLQANPLLPADIRTKLGVHDDRSDSRLLRSFLVDMLPCVIALDDTFITSSERHECREYFGSTASGISMRELLLPAGEPEGTPITCAQLRATGRAFERSTALVSLLADWSLLTNADVHARSMADGRRLRWLAADFDASLAHSHRLAQADAAKADGGAPLSLATAATRPGLAGQRRLGLMALLALSLHRPLAGPLVQEALEYLLAPETPSAHIVLLARLPPCLRAALLLLLAKRGHDGVSSQSFWHFVSVGATFLGSESLPNPPVPGERASAAKVAFEQGLAECSTFVHRLMADLPSYSKFDAELGGGASPVGTPATAPGFGVTSARASKGAASNASSSSPSRPFEGRPAMFVAKSALGASLPVIDATSLFGGEEEAAQLHLAADGAVAAQLALAGARAGTPSTYASDWRVDPQRRRGHRPVQAEGSAGVAEEAGAAGGSGCGSPPGPTAHAYPPYEPPRGPHDHQEWTTSVYQPSYPRHPTGHHGTRRRKAAPANSGGGYGGVQRVGLSDLLDYPPSMPRMPPPSEPAPAEDEPDLRQSAPQVEDARLADQQRAIAAAQGGRAGEGSGGADAGLYADNLSWAASFMIAARGAPGRRVGGDDGAALYAPPHSDGASLNGGNPSLWSSLQAPSYLLKRRDQTFLHVVHTEAPMHVDRPPTYQLGEQPAAPAAASAPFAPSEPSEANDAPAPAPPPAETEGGGGEGGGGDGGGGGGGDGAGERSGPRTQLVVSAPVVGLAGHMAGKQAATMHLETTWYAIPAKSAFVLQPQRPNEYVPPRSRLRDSVARMRESVDALGADMRSEARLLQQHSRSLSELALADRGHKARASPSRLYLSTSHLSSHLSCGRADQLGESASMPSMRTPAAAAQSPDAQLSALSAGGGSLATSGSWAATTGPHGGIGAPRRTYTTDTSEVPTSPALAGSAISMAAPRSSGERRRDKRRVPLRKPREGDSAYRSLYVYGSEA